MTSLNTIYKLTLLCTSLAIVGCTQAPVADENQLVHNIPNDWAFSAQNESKIFSPWRNDFDIPELEAVIEEALANNYDLRLAGSRLAEAHANLKFISGNQLPALNAGIDAARNQTILTDSTNPPTTLTTNNFGANLNLNWELDLWGRIQNEKSSIANETEAVLYDYEYAKLSLVAQTTKLWFNLIAAQKQLELAIATAESYLINSNQIQKRYERGLVSSLDVHLIKAQTLNAQARIQNSKKSLEEIQRALAVLLGRYPRSDEWKTDSFPIVDMGVPRFLPSDLLLRRPDLKASERRMAAAELNLKAKQKLRLPSFSLTGSLGTASSDLSDLSNSDFRVWSLLGNVTLPIFQGGKINAQISQSASQYEQAFLNYERTILKSLEEVENALAAENYLNQQYQFTAEAVEQNKKAEVLANDRYTKGLVDVLTVLDAQRRSNEAEINRINLMNAKIQNRISLILALGGGWEDPLNN